MRHIETQAIAAQLQRIAQKPEIGYTRLQAAGGQRYGRALSLIFMDIDHFKQFNDSRPTGLGENASPLLARADALVYEAKSRGRQQVVGRT